MRPLLSSSILTALLFVPAFCSASFNDVSVTHANYDAINYVQARGLVQGYADGTFKPNQTINRAEFVKILVGAYKQSKGDVPWEDSMCGTYLLSDTSPYPDVDIHAWYGMPICHANSWELVSGYPDGTFHPDATINFAESTKVIANALGFVAMPDASIWYKGYVDIIAANHAIPTSISSFDQPITRGEMAEMIYRLQTGVQNKPSKTYEQLAAPVVTGDTMMVQIYLVGGASQKSVCADGSAPFPICSEDYIPVSMLVPKSSAVLQASLDALFSLKTDENGCFQHCSGQQGVVTTELRESTLHVVSATIVNGVAHVKIEGEVVLGDVGGFAAIEQIKKTIMQFSTVKSLDVTVNGDPLDHINDEDGGGPPASSSVQLYFGDEAKIVSDSCGATRAVTRTIPKTTTVADATLRLLFAGVTADEKAQGLVSGFDNNDGYYGKGVGSLLSYYQGVSIVNGVATVKFTAGAMAYLNNTACTQEAVRGSIEATLHQFFSVKSVQFSVDGKIVTGWDA